MKKHLRIIFAFLTATMFGSVLALSVPSEYSTPVFFLSTALALFYAFFAKLPAGILGNNPAATAGNYSSTYISLQDIGMPKWYHELVAQFGSQGAEVVGMCQALGWTASLDVKLIQHYEDDWIWDSFKVMSGAGGGATATLTIDPTSIADGRFFPGVKDIIEFPTKDASGNNIQAYVEAIGANTISVRVAKSIWTIPATTDNQELFVVTNASGEGTGQPASKRTTFNLYQNDFAIVKTSVEMTGSAMTEALKWDTYDGREITGIINQTTYELDFKQMVAEQGMFLSGHRYSGLTDGGNAVLGTEGLFPALKRAGIPYGYTIWGMASYDTLEKSLSKVYASNTTGLLQGIDMDILSENILADYLKHTNVDYITKQENASLFGDNQGAAMAVGFSYILKAKRKFAMKRFESLQNPKQYGIDTYDYTRRTVGLPMKNNNIDPKTKAKVPSIRTVYRKLAGYSREKEMFTTGSANVDRYGNTNDVDNRILSCRSHMGAEFFALSNFLDIFPS